MRILLTNLSNKYFSESRQMLNESALRFGADEILSYDFGEITNSEFYIDNEEILDCPKGLGYWLWKPYIILEAMKNLVEGDIVIYSDCGIEIIESLEPLINISKTKESILLFGNGDFSNALWTKRDCFIFMDCDNEQFWYSPHCDAAFSIFRKCELSIKFLTDWLNFGRDDRILTDVPNKCGLPNLPEFIEHRRDQSILSLLAQKYNLNLYRMPTQFGNHYKAPEFRVEKEYNCVNQLNQNPVNHYSVIPYYNSNYGQLLNHHREKSFQETAELENTSDETEKPASSKGNQKTHAIKILAGKISDKLKRF